MRGWAGVERKRNHSMTCTASPSAHRTTSMGDVIEETKTDLLNSPSVRCELIRIWIWLEWSANVRSRSMHKEFIERMGEEERKLKRLYLCTHWVSPSYHANETTRTRRRANEMNLFSDEYEIRVNVSVRVSVRILLAYFVLFSFSFWVFFSCVLRRASVVKNLLELSFHSMGLCDGDDDVDNHY